MDHVISDPTTTVHKKIISASFGPSGAGNTAEIKNTIEKMRDANVRLRITPTDRDTRLHPSYPTGVRYNAQRTVEGWIIDSVRIGHDFLSNENDDKAAALIHQTAMYEAHANTHAEITPEGKFKVLPLGVSSPTIVRNAIQYRSHVPTSLAHARADLHWAFLRHNTVNMQKSAEGYRIMAYLCEAHPSLSLVRRALLEGDKEAYHSILRRNDGSCSPHKNAVSPRINGH
jgi:hypothetical protein